MSCDLIYKHIDQKVSDKEFQKHMETCAFCSEMNSRIEETLSILDIRVPEENYNITGDVLKKLDEISRPKKLVIDLPTILQFASVVAVGIFLGILLGKNSDTELMMGKKEKKEKMLIEYIDSHYLNMNEDLF